MIQSSALPKTFCQLVFTNFNSVTVTTAMLIRYYFYFPFIEWEGVRFWALGDLFSEGRNVNVKASVSLYVSSTFWAIGHRFDGDLICMRKALNCSLHTHTHGNGHQLLDFQDLYALSRNYWNLHTSDTNPSISSKERLGNDLGDPQTVGSGLQLERKCTGNTLVYFAVVPLLQQQRREGFFYQLL